MNKKDSLNNKEKAIARLRKIKALAEDGSNAEESKAAARMLERLAGRAGISPAELEPEPMKWFRFPTPTKLERGLLLQILSKVLGWDGFFSAEILSHAKGGKYIKVRMTLPHADETRVMYKILRDDWKEIVRIKYQAFLQVNNLFADDAPQSKDDDGWDNEELARLAEEMAATRKSSIPISKARRIADKSK